MRIPEKVTLLGASKVKQRVLTEALTYAPRLVAADGGAKIAVKIGQMPDFVIGDFDSIASNVLSKIPKNRQIRIAEQETTDFEKCLSVLDAPLILGVGFLGRRVDHQLAALNALVRFAHRPVILVSRREVCFHLPPDLSLPLEPGTRVSLFPLAPVCGRSEGLKWPIEGIPFAPNGRIGVSNVVKERRINLQMDGAGMLAIMPRAVLGHVVRALAP